MNAKSMLQRAPALIAMIITFLWAYGLDLLIRFLNSSIVYTFTPPRFIFLVYPIANLLLAASLLLLFWYVSFRAARSRFVSLTFIVTGLVLLFYSPATLTINRLIPTLQLPEYPVLSFVWGRTCLADAFAATAVIGLFNLFVRHETLMRTDGTR
jgi:hypothetical protein